MNAKRVVVDAVIVIAALGMLAIPYLRTAPKVRPYIPRGRLATLAPTFEWKTNGENIYGTVTVALSNSGLIDLECQIDWFDCRATNELAVPDQFVSPAGTKLVLPVGAASNVMFVALHSRKMFSGLLCCYDVHWRKPDPWLKLEAWKHPTLYSLLQQGDGWLWAPGSWTWSRSPEEGWGFGSNIDLKEYFRVVHGLDKGRWAAEEARYKIPKEVSRELFLRRMGLVDKEPITSSSGSSADQKSVKEMADEAQNFDLAKWMQGASRREARLAYEHWLGTIGWDPDGRAPPR